MTFADRLLIVKDLVTETGIIGGSLLQALRRETESLHRSLEKSDRLRSLLSPELTRNEYGEILIRFHALYEILESDVLDRREWQEAGFDFVPRLKLPLLRRDLDFLGMNEDARCGLPDRNVSFRCGDFPSLLGTLYVTEGSTLGGQIIARHLTQNLDIGPASGASFFHGYGSDTGRRWREFCALLGTYSKRISDPQRVVGAACHAFATFEEIMN